MNSNKDICFIKKLVWREKYTRFECEIHIVYIIYRKVT